MLYTQLDLNHHVAVSISNLPSLYFEICSCHSRCSKVSITEKQKWENYKALTLGFSLMFPLHPTCGLLLGNYAPNLSTSYPSILYPVPVLVGGVLGQKVGH